MHDSSKNLKKIAPFINFVIKFSTIKFANPSHPRTNTFTNPLEISDRKYCDLINKIM